MQATTKQVLETNLKVPNSFEDLSIFKCDPDEFKKFMLQEDDKEQDLDDVSTPPLTFLQLASPLNSNVTSNEKIQECSGINLEKTLDVLLENISLLISHIKIAGVEQTSIIIHEEGMLLDNTEIIIEHFDTAPGMLNIEIKACSKLQPLLINQNKSLFERIEAIAPEIKINRIAISHRDSKDYISNTKQKKVVMGDKTQNDA